MNPRAPIRDDGTVGFAAWRGQSRGMVSAHQHLDLEVNYVLKGAMRYLVGGRIVELPPHRLCLLWGGVPHQAIRGQEVVEAIWVTVPLTVVLLWGLPNQLLQPLLATGFVADSAPHTNDRDLLHQWLSDLGDRYAAPPETSPAREIVLLEIEARLRRLALGLSQQADREAEEPGDQAPVLAHSDRSLIGVEAMARFISRNFRDNVDIAKIAREAHLHPNYAMTLFRRHTGMTISQYLTLQRVAHAQRCLITTEEAIQTIALDSGFGSLSRFYEAFRQQTGNSPRRFRQQHG